MKCQNCRAENDPKAKFCNKCGKQLSAATTALLAMNKLNYLKASVWQRLIAACVDFILILSVTVILTVLMFIFLKNAIYITAPIFIFVNILFFDCYNWLMVSKYGATLGKKLLGLKVVTLDYQSVDFKTATIRELAGKFLSNIFCGIGYFWILFDSQNQAWHDLLAKTYVVVLDSQEKLISSDTIFVSKRRKTIGVLLVVFSIFQTVIVAPLFLLSIIVLISINLRPVRIAGNGMLPIYRQGQDYLTQTYTNNEPQRGDVVIVKSPLDLSKEYIKRIVGMPGDKLRIAQGRVFINDAPLDESAYLSPGTVTDPGTILKPNQEIVILPGHYFVLSDNRSSPINDSRTWGTIPRNYIYRQVTSCYWNCKK